VTILAGKETPGFADGPGEKARFSCPFGLAIDLDGSLLVSDTKNHRIRSISASGVVSTIAGSTQSGSTDGPLTEALFESPRGLAVDREGNIFVADGKRVRKISRATGTVQTLANLGESSDLWGIAATKSGNVLVADHALRMVWTVQPSGRIIPVFGPSAFTSFCGLWLVSEDNLLVTLEDWIVEVCVSDSMTFEALSAETPETRARLIRVYAQLQARSDARTEEDIYDNWGH